LAEINPFAAQKIDPELLAGETLRWADIPNARVIFHAEDWASIPFSLMWTGFVIFWECKALGLIGAPKSFDSFSAIWGIPFLLFGNYIVWGRFIHDAWLKRRTYYAITNRRALVLQEGWVRRLASTFPHELSTIHREGIQTGTLWLGPKYPVIGPRGSKKRSMSRFDVEEVLVFADIDDVDRVHRWLMELRDAGKKVPDRGKPILSFPG
jgi:hypothetical protein